ncbi:hypothetical protein I6U52_24815 [Serratia marcescens]|nr:hypothetical protein [Serratia marcescens]MBH2866084.1 hypothetical protein [Serratia marcescens]
MLHYPSPALLWTVRGLAVISMTLWTLLLYQMTVLRFSPACRTPGAHTQIKQAALIALVMSLVTALLMLSGPISLVAIIF